MCEFAYAVKCVVTSKSIVAAHSQPLADTHRAARSVRSPSAQALVRPSVQCSAFVFDPSLCKQVSFTQSVWCLFSTFVCFLSGISLFEMAVSVVLTFCLVFLGVRMQCYALRRKYICQCRECMFHDAVFPVSHPLVPAQVVWPESQELKAPVRLYDSQPYRWPWHQGITVSHHRWLGCSRSFYYSRFNLNPY